MRYIQTPVFKFSELSEKAKERVKQWANTFEFGAECVLEDFKTITDILGFYDVTPRYSGFWSQGDGASFTGRYSYAKGATKAIREYAGKDETLWNIADNLQAIQRKAFYKVKAHMTIGDHHYCHENTIDFDITKEDEYVSEAVYSEFKEEAKRLMHWLYSTLEREYEYYNSYEYLSEYCDANGYEFDINGNLI